MTSRIAHIALVILLVLAAAIGYQTRIRRNMVDFEVYRRAGRRVVSGERLYRADDGHYIFKYLPAFAFVAAPFAILEDGTARLAWFVLSCAALVAFIRIAVRALPDRRRPASIVTWLAVLFMAKFYLHELTLGQANILLGVVLVGVPLALEHDAPIATGVLAGIAVFIKPYAVIVIPWLAFAGGLTAVVASAAVIAAGLFAPALRYGWTTNLALLGDWYRTVTDTTAPNLLAADNISVAAMWGKWIGMGTPATALAAASGAMLLAVAVVVIAARRNVHTPEYLECALLMLLIPLLSPQGWDYVLLLATPAVVCLLDRANVVAPPWRWGTLGSLALLGLTIFDVMGRRAYATFMVLSVESVCALLLVVALAHLRRIRLA